MSKRILARSLDRYFQKYDPDGQKETHRHGRTQWNVQRVIMELVGQCAVPAGGALLEIGGYHGWHTVAYADQIENSRMVIYDWRDWRTAPVKEVVQFKQVNLEADRFPEKEATYDVVVCNQVFEHLKNIFRPISEIHRVLKPGGHLIISVPNVTALHNCVLFMFGHQPTTINIMGSHVRAYAIWSFSKFLEMNGHFQIVALRGIGLHPFFSGQLPGPLRTYCHTPIWQLRKTSSTLPNWEVLRSESFTTTNF